MVVGMKTRKLTASVGGMDCAACAIGIEKALKKRQGIRSASVSFATGKAEIEFEEGKCTVSEVKKEIEKQGYKAGIVDVQ